MAQTKYVVAAYELDRHYGGGEEGGWWYNSGERVRILRLFNNEDDAWHFAQRANHFLCMFQRRNRHVRDLYSVIYNGGKLNIEVYEESELPQHYPEHRPYYE